jgi:hypothetical protein
MTVEELIRKLEKIKDKSVPVVLVEWEIQNPLSKKDELTSDRLLMQAHRVAIIID